MFIQIENATGLYNLESGDPLLTEIYIALLLQKNSFFVTPSSGSDLDKIEKSLTGTEQQIKDFCLNRLNYLLTGDRIKQIVVNVVMDKRSGKAKTTISVLKQDNIWVSFQVFVRVV